MEVAAHTDKRMAFMAFRAQASSRVIHNSESQSHRVTVTELQSNNSLFRAGVWTMGVRFGGRASHPRPRQPQPAELCSKTQPGRVKSPCLRLVRKLSSQEFTALLLAALPG